MLPTVMVLIFIIVHLFRVAAVERVLTCLEVFSVEHIRYMRRRVVKVECHLTSPTAQVCRFQQRLADNDATVQRWTTCRPNCDVVCRRHHQTATDRVSQSYILYYLLIITFPPLIITDACIYFESFLFSYT